MRKCLCLWHKRALTARRMKILSVTIQMKAIEQYIHVVLFIMPFKVALTTTFPSVSQKKEF